MVIEEGFNPGSSRDETVRQIGEACSADYHE